MARRRDFVRGAAAIRSKRATLWIPFQPIVTTISAASTAVIIFSLNAAALALRPFTVVRTRGMLRVKSDQDVEDERYGGGFGIAVVSDQSVAIGATAVPTPVTDYGSDLWFVIEQIYASISSADDTGITDPLGVERILDSKAMRKVDVGQDIIVVAESPAFGTSMDLTSAFRMLVKLH